MSGKWMSFGDVMVREFIIKNVRKNLSIQDSEFPSQNVSINSTKFMELLRRWMNIGVGTFDEKLNDLEIFLRAGRSLYLKVDNETKDIQFQTINVTEKIRKINPKRDNNESSKDGMFENILSTYNSLENIERSIIDGHLNQEPVKKIPNLFR